MVSSEDSAWDVPPSIFGTRAGGPTVQRLNQASEELQLLGKTDRWTYVAGLYYFHDRASENEQSNLTFVLSPTLGALLAADEDRYRDTTVTLMLEVAGMVRFPNVEQITGGVGSGAPVGRRAQ